MAKTIALTVNGKPCSGEVEARTLLPHFLRDTLRLTGTHLGCVVGRCGACTVLWNGTPVKSCMVFAVQAANDEIVTVEGLMKDKRLHPLQLSGKTTRWNAVTARPACLCLLTAYSRR